MQFKFNAQAGQDGVEVGYICGSQGAFYMFLITNLQCNLAIFCRQIELSLFNFFLVFKQTAEWLSSVTACTRITLPINELCTRIYRSHLPSLPPPVHSFSDRSSENLSLKIPAHQSSFYGNSFTVQAVRLWNAVPLFII